MKRFLTILATLIAGLAGCADDPPKKTMRQFIDERGIPPRLPAKVAEHPFRLVSYKGTRINDAGKRTTCLWSYEGGESWYLADVSEQFWNCTEPGDTVSVDWIPLEEVEDSTCVTLAEDGSI